MTDRDRRCSSPLKIGVAGIGRMGRYHLERLGLRDDCLVTAAYDIDLNVNADTSEDLGSELFESWQCFLANAEMDVVFICTPSSEHARMAIDAMQAGKHVIVETPLSLSTTDADSMIAIANETGCMLSVAHLRRWNDDFRTARSVFEAGAIGELQTVKHINCNYRLLEEELVTTDQVPDSEEGRGVLWEFGIHLFDQLLEIVPSHPTKVFARNRDLEVEKIVGGWFLAVISFANGVTAQIEVNLSSSSTIDTGWFLSGTKGGYRKFQTSTITDDGEVFESPVESISTDWDQFYLGIIEHLCDAGKLPVTAEQGRRAVALIEACQLSVQSERVVELIDADR